MMYDALIIVNGEIAQRVLWQEISYGTLLCTDGAALELAKMDLVPNLILGDMDSFAADDPAASMALLQKTYPQTPILQIQDQDTTDFEKALHYALQQGYRRVLCLGAMGKSADHEIYNLSLLTRYTTKMDLVFLHGIGHLAQWIFPLQPHTQIQAQRDAVVSFWPMPGATLTTRGLKWELNHQNLSQTQGFSVRNRTIADTIEIHCVGPCLCFLTTPFLMK